MARVAILTGFAPTLPLFRAPLVGMLRAAGHEVVVAAPAIEPWVRKRMQAAQGRPGSQGCTRSESGLKVLSTVVISSRAAGRAIVWYAHRC